MSSDFEPEACPGCGRRAMDCIAGIDWAEAFDGTTGTCRGCDTDVVLVVFEDGSFLVRALYENDQDDEDAAVVGVPDAD